jgi:hypothetical protein
MEERPITDQNTCPAQPLASSTNPLQAYLEYYKLSPLDVALASRVRYLTVWNILKNNPVRGTHAALVRAGLQRLTGIPYTAPIPLLPLDPRKETPHARQ